jgi:hydroxymethylpyrimidine kinase/phosphomethylpyrimidine kinase/thiamine-phosphate diphosphorylase
LSTMHAMHHTTTPIEHTPSQEDNTHPQTARPIAWTIAGSDSGGGAGLQADLRAFAALQVHGCSAVAAITAQNSVAITQAVAVDTAVLDAQLAALADDMPPRAIKTGMLGSADNVRCVAHWVDRLRQRHPQQPVALVVDPVWRASTGADLASRELRQALLQELLPRATVITPNQNEAAWLLNEAAQGLNGPHDVAQAAHLLQAQGPQAVVITGGDSTHPQALDFVLACEDHGWLTLPRIHSPHHHGSGCTHASALAAAMALGFCTADAAVLAKMCSAQAIEQGYAAGQGAGPVQAQPGFARHGSKLPRWQDEPDFVGQPFAPLRQPDMGLYAITDSADHLTALLAAGVGTVQLRIKQDGPAALPAQQLSAAIRHAVRAAQAAGAQLFINDHWELALEHGADGVHLGQEDMGKADLPALQSAGLRLGLSTHSVWEVSRAHALQPSYIACGPIHATTTKDMPWRPQGPGNLAYWCHVLPTPVVAIAGMDPDRARQARRCGAAGVAVLRGLGPQVDWVAAVTHYQEALGQGALDTPWPVPQIPRSTLNALARSAT